MDETIEGVDDTSDNRANLQLIEEILTIEPAPSVEVKSNVVTSANKTRVDEDTDN